MKNIILGCVGAAITLYITLMILSLYTVYVHQNELDRVLSRVMWSTMNRVYYPPAGIFSQEEGGDEEETAAVSNAEVRRQFTRELTEALSDHEQVAVRVMACDMEAGILSAEVTELIPLPGGDEKMIQRSRTIIWDRTGAEP